MLNRRRSISDVEVRRGLPSASLGRHAKCSRVRGARRLRSSTSFDFGPVISIKDRGMTDPATVVIQGLGVGMISCVPPTIVLAVAIVATSALGDS